MTRRSAGGSAVGLLILVFGPVAYVAAQGDVAAWLVASPALLAVAFIVTGKSRDDASLLGRFSRRAREHLATTISALVLYSGAIAIGLWVGRSCRSIEASSQQEAQSKREAEEREKARQAEVQREADLRASREIEAREKTKREAAEAVARRTGADWAKLVDEALAKEDVVDAACSARTIVAEVPSNKRDDAAVKKAIAALKLKELAALRVQQAEAEKFRPLLCADGTTSDSCLCGKARRGCCSRHGGVRGCAPLPIELNCSVH